MAAQAQGAEFTRVVDSHGTVWRTRRWVWNFVRTKPLGAMGFLILVAFLLIGISAGQLQKTDPATFDVIKLLQPPDSQNWFGTDQFGRDIYSRIVHGSRIAMTVGLVAPLISMIIGTTVGLVSGYFGGWVDMVLQRFVDAMLAFPAIVLGLAIVTALEPSVRNIIIAIGIISAPGFSRVVRGSVLSVKENMYIEAAKSLGQSPTMIMARHILPNVAAPIIVVSTASVGTAILAEAAISFLGFGPANEATWGQMMGIEARTYLTSAWWLAVVPGTAIALAVLAANLFGDALRDVLDPRLRGR